MSQVIGDTPPRNLEAEQAVLGSMLLDRNAIPKAKELLRPTDFYFDRHGLIFSTLIEMFERDEPIDLVTITDRLREAGQLDTVGGASYVTGLLDATVTPSNVEHYARIVQRDAVKRRGSLTLQEAAQKIIRGDGRSVSSDVRRVIEELEHGASPSMAVRLTSASAIKIEQAVWLWKMRVATGALLVIAGQPGLGKSTLSLEVAARATRGQLSGDLNGQPIAVVVATAEDSLSTTVVPRLIAAGAELSNIHFVDVKRDGISGHILIPDDIPEIKVRMQQVNARLLIVDPLVAHLPGSVNSWHDQDIRRALAPLAQLAEDLQTAVIVVVHLNKRDTTDVLSRISGSVGIPAAARSVLIAASDPQDPEAPTRVLAHVKCNLGPLAPTLRYRLEGRIVDGLDGKVQTSGIAWMGEAPEVRVADILASQTAEERNDRQEAAGWLQGFLADGPKPTKDVLREGRQNGFSEITLRRAKQTLHVRAYRDDFHGPWYWKLPQDDHLAPEDDQYTASDHLGENKPLARALDADVAQDDHILDIDHLGGVGDHLAHTSEASPPSADPLPLPDSTQEGQSVDPNHLVKFAIELFKGEVTYDGPPQTGLWGIPLGREVGIAMVRMGQDLGYPVIPATQGTLWADISPCPWCRGTTFWRSRSGPVICKTCHPPATKNLIAQWVDASTDAERIHPRVDSGMQAWRRFMLASSEDECKQFFETLEQLEAQNKFKLLVLGEAKAAGYPSVRLNGGWIIAEASVPSEDGCSEGDIEVREAAWRQFIKVSSGAMLKLALQAIRRSAQGFGGLGRSVPSR